MHGFIFSETKKFVASNFGTVAWFTILEQAGFPSKEYENYLEYPDEELIRIVETASELTQIPVATIILDFGTFLGADLMKIYKPLIHKDWKTLEFFMNTEETIHEVVRARNTQAKPPALHFERQDEETVILTYGSKRGLCALAKGIATGVSNHYEETLYIDDLACVSNGDTVCKVRFSTRAALDG